MLSLHYNLNNNMLNILVYFPDVHTDKGCSVLHWAHSFGFTACDCLFFFQCYALITGISSSNRCLFKFNITSLHCPWFGCRLCPFDNFSNRFHKVLFQIKDNMIFHQSHLCILTARNAAAVSIHRILGDLWVCWRLLRLLKWYSKWRQISSWILSCGHKY